MVPFSSVQGNIENITAGQQSFDLLTTTTPQNRTPSSVFLKTIEIVNDEHALTFLDSILVYFS